MGKLVLSYDALTYMILQNSLCCKSKDHLHSLDFPHVDSDLGYWCFDIYASEWKYLIGVRIHPHVVIVRINAFKCKNVYKCNDEVPVCITLVFV